MFFLQPRQQWIIFTIVDTQVKDFLGIFVPDFDSYARDKIISTLFFVRIKSIYVYRMIIGTTKIFWTSILIASYTTIFFKSRKNFQLRRVWHNSPSFWAGTSRKSTPGQNRESGIPLKIQKVSRMVGSLNNQSGRSPNRPTNVTMHLK